jgi:hypothetical protein
MPDEGIHKDDLRSFTRLVDALAPWLNQVVIIGGWAHRLYRIHPLAQPLDYDPLATFDTDVAMPAELPEQAQSMRARLAESGFEEELLGDTRPPAVHYRLTAGNAGFYAEFLTPLIGSVNKRGRRDATASIAGVSAQKLRYLELLLAVPWKVEVGTATGYPTTERHVVQIPNPVAFLVQKLLIHDRREPSDRAKDLLYIHDTIETFGDALPELRKLWQGAVRPLLSPKARRSIEAAPTAFLGEVNDSVREAVMMAPERLSSPSQLIETCEVGLSAILA